MERVFPDTNVLYPISLANLVLRLGDASIHEVLWSPDLLSEVERTLVKRKGLPPDKAAYFCRCIREAFPEGEIKRADYRRLIASRQGPDTDDHLHSAAAVAGGATVLLTSNTRDYPPSDLGDVRLETPDDYLVSVLESAPADVLVILREMGAQRRVQESVDETLAALQRGGLKTFVERAAQLLATRPTDTSPE